MPRTTLDLDSSVLAQLRKRARSEGKSMGQLASERLAEALGSERAPRLAPFVWASRRMGKPSVDLTDKDALWRALEERPAKAGESGTPDTRTGGGGAEQSADASRTP